MSADSDLVLRNLLDACDRGRPLSDIHDRLRVEVGRLGCPECGQTGACAYDADGRALIHVTGDED